VHDKFERLVHKYPRLLHGTGFTRRGFIYAKMARQRVKRGTEILSKGRCVVTDRLHGHILCVLLGIPHVCMDNEYGKISSFFQTWSRSCPELAFAQTATAAAEKVTAIAL
jgi:pyruvyl transferase EpsO